MLILLNNNGNDIIINSNNYNFIMKADRNSDSNLFYHIDAQNIHNGECITLYNGLLKHQCKKKFEELISIFQKNKEHVYRINN